MFTKYKSKDSTSNFRKSLEISASNIKPFSSYAQEKHGSDRVNNLNPYLTEFYDLSDFLRNLVAILFPVLC